LSAERTHFPRWRFVALGGLLLPVLYFGSLGPVHVWHHRACRSADFQTALRYEEALGVYSWPAWFITSHAPGLKRVTARYVHWWITATHTRRPWRSSDYWYDSYDSDTYSVSLNNQALGQVCATNTTTGKVLANSIGRAQAVRLASQLKIGMQEEVAKEYLRTNGLEWSDGDGSSFGWFDSFRLTNGCDLVLDIKPKTIRGDGLWKDGLLQGAFLYSNGVKIADITLTNAP
jgi:hypothetical protein